MVKYESVDTVEALPLATSIGQMALCSGCLYEVTSLNPKVWSLVRDNSGVVIRGQTGDFLSDNNISFVKDCHFQAVTSGGFRISGNKIIDYAPLPTSEYKETIEELIDQREALIVYKNGSLKPELVKKFLELNYHQLRIIAVLIEPVDIASPQIDITLLNFLKNGVFLDCKLLRDGELLDLVGEFSEFRSAYCNKTSIVRLLNTKLNCHVEKRYEAALIELCKMLDEKLPNNSDKKFFELLRGEEYFTIKGLVIFLECLVVTVSEITNTNLNEIDLFYYFCGGGDVRMVVDDMKADRFLNFGLFSVKRELKTLLGKIGFNLILE